MLIRAISAQFLMDVQSHGWDMGKGCGGGESSEDKEVQYSQGYPLLGWGIIKDLHRHMPDPTIKDE